MATIAPHTVGSRLLAEGFGTFVLVLGVIGTAIFSSSNTGYLGVALAIGVSVAAAAYAVGHISGGHFNPAVSLGVALAGRMPWNDVLPYVGAQLVGGTLATTVVFTIAANGPAGFLAEVQAAGFASNGFDDHSPDGFGLVAVLLAEVVLSAVLLYVILAVTAPESTTPGFAPIAVGITLTVIHLVAIPISNASVNPARSIATALYGGGDALAQLWVFLLAPAVGAAIAGVTWRRFLGRPAV